MCVMPRVVDPNLSALPHVSVGDWNIEDPQNSVQNLQSPFVFCLMTFQMVIYQKHREKATAFLHLFFNFSKSNSIFMRLCTRIFQDRVITFNNHINNKIIYNYDSPKVEGTKLWPDQDI